MPQDILASIRDEIMQEDEPMLPWAPKHLDQSWEKQASIAGLVTGLLTGLALGSHMGLAGPWGAIAGTIPCAIVGGVMGYLSGAKIGSSIKRGESVTLDPNIMRSMRAIDAGTQRSIEEKLQETVVEPVEPIKEVVSAEPRVQPKGKYSTICAKYAKDITGSAHTDANDSKGQS